MVEEWRDIAGYEGLYQVSNLGRVKSLEKQVRTRGGWRTQKEMIKKSCRTGKHRQYFFVALTKDGKATQFYVHRLVADAFLDNPEQKPCVDHIDCDPSNNCTSNLRWVTYLENSANPLTYKRTYKNGERMKKRGHTAEMKKHFSDMRKGIRPPCKSDRAVINVETGERFETIKAAAEWCGRCPNTVITAIRRNGTGGGYHWRYA